MVLLLGRSREDSVNSTANNVLESYLAVSGEREREREREKQRERERERDQPTYIYIYIEREHTIKKDH